MQYESFTAYNDIFHYWNMKEHVFLSNTHSGIVKDYWIMHFLNTTNVLIDSFVLEILLFCETYVPYNNHVQGGHSF